jgi:hypothetical protein
MSGRYISRSRTGDDVKKIYALVALLACMFVLVLVSPASAADDRDCSDFASPVIITDGYDPAHLDADHDGIGCESNPGRPVAMDVYSDLRDPVLAHTGAGDVVQRHPVRTIGVAGLLVAGGTATLIVVRRRTRNGE